MKSGFNFNNNNDNTHLSFKFCIAMCAQPVLSSSDHHLFSGFLQLIEDYFRGVGYILLLDVCNK